MAFVTRAPKTNSLLQDIATPNEVGPGRYEVNSKSRLWPSSAPFASTVPRMPDSNAELPGPGEYDVTAPPRSNSAFRFNPETATFSSRVPRIQPEKSSVLETPGPGAYAPSPKWLRDSLRWHADPPKPRIALHRTMNAPSVPGKYHSSGYEEGANGQLVLQAPAGVRHSGRGLDLPGPGEYEPKADITHAARPAPKISNAQMSRLTFVRPSSAPGPGAYDVDQYKKAPQRRPLSAEPDQAPPKSAITALRAARERRRILKLQGEADAAVLGTPQDGIEAVRITSCSAPEAGQYQTPALLDGFRLRRVVPEHLQNFGSRAPRSFQVDESRLQSAPTYFSTPGPGSYAAAPSVSAQLIQRRMHSSEAFTPFLSSENRFKSSDPHAGMPGPGLYVPTAQTLRGRVEAMKAARSGSFGIGTRFREPSAAVQQSEVGPGSYDPPPSSSTAASRANAGPSAAFSSGRSPEPPHQPKGRAASKSPQSQRSGGPHHSHQHQHYHFPPHPRLLDLGSHGQPSAPSIPKPYTHEPPGTQNRNRTPARMAEASGLSVGLLDGSGLSEESWVAKALRRKARGCTVGHGPRFQENKEAARMPGPGSYENVMRREAFKPKYRTRGAAFAVGAQRFDEDWRPGPGPGAYSVDVPLYSMLKESFNVTLDKAGAPRKPAEGHYSSISVR